MGKVVRGKENVFIDLTTYYFLHTPIFQNLKS